MVLRSTIVFFLLTSLAQMVAGQNIVYDAEHNATTIIGTWSSGSRNVQTGPKFANPAKRTFTYPNTTGISYSFDNDGTYEVARYRFVSNGAKPTCITGVINWNHGNYTLNPNGSITLRPRPDGFQQIQDPCAAISNFIEVMEAEETYTNWRIFLDASAGPKLHLFQYDGAPLPPMFQVSRTPIMLPKENLIPVEDGSQLTRRDLSAAEQAGIPALLAAASASLLASVLAL